MSRRRRLVALGTAVVAVSALVVSAAWSQSTTITVPPGEVDGAREYVRGPALLADGSVLVGYQPRRDTFSVLRLAPGAGRFEEVLREPLPVAPAGISAVVSISAAGADFLVARQTLRCPPDELTIGCYPDVVQSSVVLHRLDGGPSRTLTSCLGAACKRCFGWPGAPFINKYHQVPSLNVRADGNRALVIPTCDLPGPSSGPAVIDLASMARTPVTLPNYIDDGQLAGDYLAAEGVFDGGSRTVQIQN